MSWLSFISCSSRALLAWSLPAIRSSKESIRRPKNRQSVIDGSTCFPSSTRFPSAGLSAAHFCADWLLNWSLAAKWAQLLITHLTAAYPIYTLRIKMRWGLGWLEVITNSGLMRWVPKLRRVRFYFQTNIKKQVRTRDGLHITLLERVYHNASTTTCNYSHYSSTHHHDLTLGTLDKLEVVRSWTHLVA